MMKKIHGNKGKMFSEEHKRKIGEANKGKKRSEETRNRLRETHLGYKPSIIQRKNIGKGLRRAWKLGKRKYHPNAGFQVGHIQFNTGKTRWKKGQHISTRTEFKKGRKLSNEELERVRKMAKARKGISRSDSTKEKIRKNHARYMLGRHHSEKTKEKMRGHIPWNKGKEHSEKTKRKISEIQIGRICSVETREKMSQSHLKIKEKHWNWKGGITIENNKIRHNIEIRLWRESVYARDNWTCQKCRDSGGGNLNPHHIRNFAQWPELRFAIDNGITFCKECHKSFHKKYGKTNNTKEQVEEFIIN